MSFAYNSIFKTNWLRRKANAIVGFHPDRTIPLVAKQTLRAWFDKGTRKIIRVEWYTCFVMSLPITSMLKSEKKRFSYWKRWDTTWSYQNMKRVAGLSCRRDW